MLSVIKAISYTYPMTDWVWQPLGLIPYKSRTFYGHFHIRAAQTYNEIAFERPVTKDVVAVHYILKDFMDPYAGEIQNPNIPSVEFTLIVTTLRKYINDTLPERHKKLCNLD